MNLKSVLQIIQGWVKIRGADGQHFVDVTLDAGKKKMETLTTLSIPPAERGRVSKPDSYFRIDAAGAIGDTIRVQLAATSGDTTTPDRDISAVDETYTLVAEDVGDELKLRDNVISYMNGRSGFNTSLKASKAKDRGVVWVESKFFSVTGEFYERPAAGDFQVTTTGTTVVTVGFDTFIARTKEAAAQPDPDNPHVQSVFGISGTVRTLPSDVQDILEEYAKDSGGSNELDIDGDATPTEYTIDANPAGGKRKIINSLKFYGRDTAVKLGESNFYGLNSALTNGIKFEITKNGTTSEVRNIKSTNDVLARLSSSPEKVLFLQSTSTDYLEAVFDFVATGLRLTLEPGTNDQIKITIRDKLDAISSLRVKVDGFQEDT